MWPGGAAAIARACRAIENGAFLQRFSLLHVEWNISFMMLTPLGGALQDQGSASGIRNASILFWSWRECRDPSLRIFITIHSITVAP
jgi:hypothetical protein